MRQPHTGNYSTGLGLRYRDLLLSLTTCATTEISSAQHASETPPSALFAKACWLWGRPRPYNTESFHVGHRSLIKQEQHPPNQGQNICILFPIAGTISLCSLVILCVSMVKRNPSPRRFKTLCIQVRSQAAKARGKLSAASCRGLGTDTGSWPPQLSA